MIKLFYTGSGSFNSPQTLASKSLGGFISNSSIPNGVLNSLFPPLSLMEFFKEKKTIDYIGLGLYLFFFEGETSYKKVNLNFTLQYDEENDEAAEYFKDLFEYKIALAPISGDNTNGYYMESITSEAKPFYLLEDFKNLVFDEEVTFENVELLNSGIGIWVCRIFNPKTFKNKFGFDKDYWIENEKIPNLDFSLKLNTTFVGVEEQEGSGEPIQRPSDFKIKISSLKDKEGNDIDVTLVYLIFRIRDQYGFIYSAISDPDGKDSINTKIIDGVLYIAVENTSLRGNLEMSVGIRSEDSTFPDGYCTTFSEFKPLNVDYKMYNANIDEESNSEE